jgi:hypothetical protein
MRARPRMVHQSLLVHVTAEMSRLRWTVAGGFKEQGAFTIVDHEPISGALPAPNTVGVSLGPEGSGKAVEMGGGLRAITYTLFIDVYGESPPVALHLASDLKDLLEESFVPLYDYSATPPVLSADSLEVADCFRVEPTVNASSPDALRNWQVVKVALLCTFVPST